MDYLSKLHMAGCLWFNVNILLSLGFLRFYAAIIYSGISWLLFVPRKVAALCLLTSSSSPSGQRVNISQLLKNNTEHYFSKAGKIAEHVNPSLGSTGEHTNVTSETYGSYISHWWWVCWWEGHEGHTVKSVMPFNLLSGVYTLGRFCSL